MKQLILHLSPVAEIAVVLTLTLGLFVYGGISQYLNPPAATDPYFTNASLIGLVIFEIFLFALVAPVLRLRGWTLPAIGLSPTARQTLAGFLLAPLGLLIFALVDAIGPGSAPNATTDAAMIPSANLAFGTILGVSLINAIYEEVFVTGYLIEAVSERSSVIYAVAGSALLRASYHLYQGPVAAISIGLLGLAFALLYVRGRVLWPIIVAHTILDVIAFLATAGP